MRTILHQDNHHGKPIAFPKLHRFEDFFPEMGPKPKRLYEGKADNGQKWIISSYVYITDRQQRQDNQAQRLPPFLMAWLKENLLRVPNDSISFQVVPWEDGRALVIAQYSQILGDRYLGIIAAHTIPAWVEPMDGDSL